jgi:hypothetical protein
MEVYQPMNQAGRKTVLIPILAILLGTGLLACAEPEEAPETSAKSSDQNDSETNSATLSGDYYDVDYLNERISVEDDPIVTTGPIGSSKFAIGLASGKGFLVNGANRTFKATAPLVTAEEDKISAYAAGDHYVWEFVHDNLTIGRNRLPPSAGGKVDISKVTIDDLVSTPADLIPVSASEDDFLFISDEKLVVCTFQEETIVVVNIPLPTEDFEASKVIGGGKMGNGGFWLATKKEVLLFDGTNWIPSEIKMDDDDLVAVTLQLGKSATDLTGPAMGVRKNNKIGIYYDKDVEIKSDDLTFEGGEE